MADKHSRSRSRSVSSISDSDNSRSSSPTRSDAEEENGKYKIDSYVVEESKKKKLVKNTSKKPDGKKPEKRTSRPTSRSTKTKRGIVYSDEEEDVSKKSRKIVKTKEVKKDLVEFGSFNFDLESYNKEIDKETLIVISNFDTISGTYKSLKNYNYNQMVILYQGKSFNLSNLCNFVFSILTLEENGKFSFSEDEEDSDFKIYEYTDLDLNTVPKIKYKTFLELTQKFFFSFLKSSKFDDKASTFQEFITKKSEGSFLQPRVTGHVQKKSMGGNTLPLSGMILIRYREEASKNFSKIVWPDTSQNKLELLHKALNSNSETSIPIYFQIGIYKDNLTPISGTSKHGLALIDLTHLDLIEKKDYKTYIVKGYLVCKLVSSS